MKRVVILTLLGLTLGALAANSSVITNTCTSTYRLVGLGWVVSGGDTASVTLDTEPIITVTKYVKNVRTGIESNDLVYALQGDTIEFRIVWSNDGGADANTVTLTDYIPGGMSFITGSLTSSETNCSSGSSNESGGCITYRAFGAVGTNPGPHGYGEMKFRVKID
jgi:uncharacterized repeat protein (TIGR01451 family)